MRALVTGAAGFIGRHFVSGLTEQGWTVEAWDVTRPSYGYQGDIMNSLIAQSQSEVCVLGYDLVIHAAAQTPHRAAIDKSPTMHLYNRMLDAAMFHWVAKTQVDCHVVYFSSCAVLDSFPDDYGLTKLAGEHMADLVSRGDITISVVRPFSGYGSDQSEDFPFGAFIGRAKRREDPFPVWNPRAIRDWIHVDDIVGACLALAKARYNAHPISLCTGVGHSMQEVIDMICVEVGYSPTMQVLDDMPQGSLRRMGDPGAMLEYYTPRVSLLEGIRRALAA